MGDGGTGRDEPNVVHAALFGCCPRCANGRLFHGYLTVAPCCGSCGLDFAPFDAGDGPAVFVILIVGFLVAGSALIVEVTLQPPYWVHAVIWIPLIFILTFSLLRLVKALLLTLQYKHRAGEGRLAD
ncbi:MAG TPA: DUF983 domain-containing protein [Rhizomicrobium sp.]|nr:DUF983 domain-containing protein [Rhizomicrobium sp.]